MYLKRIELYNLFSCIKVPMRYWSGVMLHHGASTGALESYAKYHILNKKWTDFGYHIGIEKNGDVYISDTEQSRWVYQRDGAHCKEKVSLDGSIVLPASANRVLLGIVLRGDFVGNVFPTVEQWVSLSMLLEVLFKRLNLTSKDLYRHDWFAYKSHGCPGKSFDWNSLLALFQDKGDNR